jgi:phenylacetate-CoA ligase
MTEVGPVTYQCPTRAGVLHVMEKAYLAEILDPITHQTPAHGQPGELVLTTLGRTGSPLLRYRTGDWVRAASTAPCACGRNELALEGGILGRVDDMLIVRGVNLYPSAVEQVIRSCAGVAEFQVEVDRSRPLPEIEVRIEPSPTCAQPHHLRRQLEQALSQAFALRIPVRAVPVGALPRFEMKARRWITRGP